MIDLTLLEDNPLFEDFSQKELEVFFENANQLEFRPDEILFHEGEIGTEMYVVLSGEINIFKEKGVDEPSLLASLPEGTFLGEMSLIDQAPRSAMVKAGEQDVRTVVFSRGYIESVGKTDPEIVCKFLHNIMKVSAGRTRGQIERLISSKQTLENIE